LKKIQQELNKQGLGLTIWDAYRPHNYQAILASYASDPQYVADPKKGSNHNRGIAVDITLIYLQSKKELSMPTEFDTFTEQAHSDYEKIPGIKKENRALLQRIMRKYGWQTINSEWWHFSFKPKSAAPLLKIPFEDLAY
jgi:D-alanyl-D-alanine dipeptidase